MWLIILALAAAIVTPIWYGMAENDRYMLKVLCLILWGATIMVFVDHTIACVVFGEEFWDFSLNAALLGITMLIGALVLWEVVLLLKDPRGVLYKRKSKST
jgi:hypothetical protein